MMTLLKTFSGDTFRQAQIANISASLFTRGFLAPVAEKILVVSCALQTTIVLSTSVVKVDQAKRISRVTLIDRAWILTICDVPVM